MTNDEFLSLRKGDMVCQRRVWDGRALNGRPTPTFDRYGIVIKEVELVKRISSEEDYYSVCLFWLHEEKRNWITTRYCLAYKELIENITIEARADGSKV